MANYGIKISKPGYDVKTLDAENNSRNLVFTSKFDNLKIAKTGSGTFSTGSSAIIAHGLGYPAAFITYLSTDNVNFYIYDGISYCDSTNLVISKPRPIIINDYFHGANTDYGLDASGLGYFYADFAVGKGSTIIYDGALRFRNIQETSSIDKAEIHVKITSPLPRTGTVGVQTYGINEDNTADFSSRPFSRPNTSAVIVNSCDNGITDIWSYEVTNIFKEITGRSGWSSGNAMGFKLLHYAEVTNAHIFSSSGQSFLRVYKTEATQTVYYKYVIFTHKLDSTKVL